MAYGTLLVSCRNPEDLTSKKLDMWKFRNITLYSNEDKRRQETLVHIIKRKSDDFLIKENSFMEASV